MSILESLRSIQGGSKGKFRELFKGSQGISEVFHGVSGAFQGIPGSFMEYMEVAEAFQGHLWGSRWSHLVSGGCMGSLRCIILLKRFWKSRNAFEIPLNTFKLYKALQKKNLEIS